MTTLLSHQSVSSLRASSTPTSTHLAPSALVYLTRMRAGNLQSLSSRYCSASRSCWTLPMTRALHSLMPIWCSRSSWQNTGRKCAGRQTATHRRAEVGNPSAAAVCVCGCVSLAVRLMGHSISAVFGVLAPRQDWCCVDALVWQPACGSVQSRTESTHACLCNAPMDPALCGFLRRAGCCSASVSCCCSVGV